MKKGTSIKGLITVAVVALVAVAAASRISAVKSIVFGGGA